MAAPKIYYSRLSDYTITMSETENSSFPLSNLKTYFEADLWKSSNSTNGQTITINFGSARSRNFIALAKSNHDNITTAVLEAADDSGFTTGLVTPVSNLRTATPTVSDAANNREIFEFSAVTKQYWRIRYADLTAVPPNGPKTPEIGQIFIDTLFQFQFPYDFPYEKDNARFQTTERVALDGRLRMSQPFQGRVWNRFRFSLFNDATRTSFLTFQKTVRGKLYPWYFLDVDGTTLYYVHAENDMIPVETRRYQQNDMEELIMKEQLATAV